MNRTSPFAKILLIIAFSGLLFCEAAVSAVLSGKTLESDLIFYRKTSAEKKLGANDRYYILLRIEQKYQDSKVNLAPLKAEMEKVRNKPAADKPVAVQTAPAAATSPAVTAILVSETPGETKITITADNVTRSNYFVMRDPDPAMQPKLILDLYGVEEKLGERSKDITLKNGIFSNVRAGQFQKDPENIVRIVAEFREERPYKISNDGDKWFITAAKDQPKDAAAAAAPALAAPAVAASAVADSTAAAKSSAQSNYTIDTGDVLGVIVYPAEELSREAVVQIDGSITMPLIGQVEAKGQTVKRLEETLSDKLGKFVTNPQVSVVVRQFSRRQVFITGEVRSVGAYSYKEGMRLMEFISQAGGFTDSANRREVRIFRGPATKRQTTKYDVEELVKSGDFSKDFPLEPGDIIEVPKGQEKVSILGDVRSPGYYDYREKITLIELVSLAGGFTDSANISKVTIIDNSDGKNKKVTKVDMNKILSGKDKDITIHSGDTVYIPKKPMAASNLFLNNILPWLSLIALVLAIGAA